MKTRLWSLLLVLAMLLSLSLPAAAEEAPADITPTSEETEPSAETETPEEIGLPAVTAAPVPSEEETPDDASVPSPAETEPADKAADITGEAAGEDAFPLVTDGSYVDTEKAIVAKIITAGMSNYDKLYAITKYAADNYSYSSDWTISGFLANGAGSCDASTQFIIDLCTLVGIKAWLRKAGMDPGAGSTHVCAAAIIDGEYYTASAGYTGTKPRSFDVTQIPGGLTVRDGVLLQYDGLGVEHLIIPAVAPTATVVKRNRTYTQGGESITQIGKSGMLCFNYSGCGSTLKSITLPKTVKTVTGTAFRGCSNLENIYVDADNPYFTSIDGVLYSKDLTRLVCVPAKKTAVTIPSTVKTQDSDAFYGGKIPVTVSQSGLPFTDVTNQWFASSVRFVYSRSLFKGTSATQFSPNTNMTRGMFITVLGRFAGSGQWSTLENWSGDLGITNGGGIAVRDKTTTASGSSVLARTSTAGEFVTVLSKVEKGEDGAVWYRVKYGGYTGYIREKSTGSSAKTLLNVYTGGFQDLPAGAYYTGYAQWANTFGVMNGVSSTQFSPDQKIKREDICVLMYRYLTNYLGKSVSSQGTAFSDDGSISSYAKTAVYAMRAVGVVNGYPDNTFLPKSYATRAEVAKMFENLYNYLNG